MLRLARARRLRNYSLLVAKGRPIRRFRRPGQAWSTLRRSWRLVRSTCHVWCAWGHCTISVLSPTRELLLTNDFFVNLVWLAYRWKNMVQLTLPTAPGSDSESENQLPLFRFGGAV